ncbi:MAG TPA: hypothetical protein VFV98_00380 [Vicinamibacterales bacterium]|nr:hypothetical protein [Vicinamibacterales bacterium]
MPDRETLKRAHQDAREGKSPSTQAGEFVREEIHHISPARSAASRSKASRSARAKRAAQTRKRTGH